MNAKLQDIAPLMEALISFKKNRIVPFDVPGHKRGKGNPELTAFLGEQCLSVDVNSMKPLDNLNHPTSVIKHAEELAAQAFGAAQAFFMVGGTTSSVQAMIMATCQEGDKIILPRNVHRSVINALILCGAEPVYVDPGLNSRLGIPLGMSTARVEEALRNNPGAAALLVNNPTYYGVCSNLAEITRLGHAYGLKVLVDEAHGTHFYFGSHMPQNAMAAGADMASVSMHKSGGSLTQSSILLLNKGVNPGQVRQTINLTQTTSASYLLLASLDIARKKLAMEGEEIFDLICDMTAYARAEINAIGGYYAFAREIIDGDSSFDFDPSKLSVNTLGTGLAGIEVYDILRNEFGIQIEFGDIGNFLAYISVGDSYKDIERLVSALAEIYRVHKKDRPPAFAHEYIAPTVAMPPRRAFYAGKESLPLARAAGLVAAEFIMCYPPGIPILAPGETISQDIIDYISYAKAKGCLLTGAQDLSAECINVIKG